MGYSDFNGAIIRDFDDVGPKYAFGKCSVCGSDITLSSDVLNVADCVPVRFLCESCRDVDEDFVDWYEEEY